MHHINSAPLYLPIAIIICSLVHAVLCCVVLCVAELNQGTSNQQITDIAARHHNMYDQTYVFFLHIERKEFSNTAETETMKPPNFQPVSSLQTQNS